MKARQRPAPLDQQSLQGLALHYVGRFATTRYKLATYLRRKVRERGWVDEGSADIEAIVARCIALGFVDDAAFAEMRSAALTRRGYGTRRIGQALATAGIDRETAAALAHDDDAALAAAESFARRRRIGPFAGADADEATQRRWFAAMVRAGHSFELARRFSCPTGIIEE